MRSKIREVLLEQYDISLGMLVLGLGLDVSLRTAQKSLALTLKLKSLALQF